MITDAIEATVHPDKPFTSDHKAYMLPKGSQLTQRTNAWLVQTLNNGTFKRLYDEWMQ